MVLAVGREASRKIQELKKDENDKKMIEIERN